MVGFKDYRDDVGELPRDQTFSPLLLPTPAGPLSSLSLSSLFLSLYLSLLLSLFLSLFLFPTLFLRNQVISLSLSLAALLSLALALALSLSR